MMIDSNMTFQFYLRSVFWKFRSFATLTESCHDLGNIPYSRQGLLSWTCWNANLDLVDPEPDRVHLHQI